MTEISHCRRHLLSITKQIISATKRQYSSNNNSLSTNNINKPLTNFSTLPHSLFPFNPDYYQPYKMDKPSNKIILFLSTNHYITKPITIIPIHSFKSQRPTVTYRIVNNVLLTRNWIHHSISKPLISFLMLNLCISKSFVQSVPKGTSSTGTHYLKKSYKLSSHLNTLK